MSISELQEAIQGDLGFAPEHALICAMLVRALVYNHGETQETFTPLMRQGDVATTVAHLYARQIEVIKASIDPNKKTVVVLQSNHSEGHSVAMGEVFNKQNLYNFFYFVQPDIRLTTDDSSFFKKIDRVYCLPTNDFQHFSFADLLISLDYYTLPGMPASVCTVATEHAVNAIPPNLEDPYYIGRLVLAHCHDYFFYSCPLDHIPVDEDRYLDFLPKHMTRPGQDAFCMVPVGGIKLDNFIQYCQSHPNEEKYIILHISNMSRISSTFEKHATDIINYLLLNYPQYDILFRHRPGIQDISRLQGVLERFSTEPRFHYYTDTSYTAKYSQAAFMIAFGVSSSNFAFPYATGKPVLFFRGEDDQDLRIDVPEVNKKVGYYVSTLDELSAAIQKILAAPEQERDRIFEFRKKHIANPGACRQYILDIIPDLLEKKYHPGWRKYNLFSGENHSPLEQYRISFQKNKPYLGIQPWTAHELGNAATKAFPDDWEMWYYLSWYHYHQWKWVVHGSHFPLLEQTLQSLCRAVELFTEKPGNKPPALIEEFESFLDNFPTKELLSWLSDYMQKNKAREDAYIHKILSLTR